MNPQLRIQALVLSAGIATMTSLSGSSENVRSSVERTKESASQALSPKENTSQLRENITLNTTEYLVQKNDTVASIASNLGMSTIELVELNAFLGKPFAQRGKNGNNILIKLGEPIFIPNDMALFRTHIDRMAEHTRVEKLNQKVLNGETNTINAEPIFASSVRSIGLPNILSGFVRSQELSYDPSHPRVVDWQWQKDTNCANAMRALMFQSMNMADLSSKEQAFQRKQNVDAWMLPTELMIIGYEQQFPEIMSMFDPWAIWSANPIKKEREKDYHKAIRSMHTLLETAGDSLVGSFVPYYFKRSHYKNVVADYNKIRKDKHYNTHQSMFAGNATMKFPAWNVPIVRNGVMETFWGDKKSAPEEIEQLKKEELPIKYESKINLQKIISLTDPKNNPELSKKLSRHISVIQPLLESQKNLSHEERKVKEDKIIELLKEWTVATQDSIVEKIQKIVPKYKLSRVSVMYLASFMSYPSEFKKFTELLRKTVSESDTTPIDGTKFGMTIANNVLIQQAIENHNSALKQQGDYRKTIAHKQALLERPANSISVIDFVLNFIQSRSDFGGSLSDGYRKEILNGLSIYGDLLHIKINGESVDIMKELDIYKSNKSKGMMVLPDHVFEITGPMMVDGEKQWTHSDVSRQKYMNIRTRFFFEFFLSQSYLPTELLSPGNNSSYLLWDQSKHVKDLKIPGVYGLNIKYDEHGEFQRNKHNQVLSESIDEVLKREIVKYEKLDPTDPKFQEKVRFHYSLQIKALQIAGFMQDENTLNKSAVNINRAIPYYSPSNISQVFSAYIKDKRQEIHAENGRLSEMRNYITIRTLPGDTYRQIFSSIIKYTSTLGKTAERYPNVRELSRLQDYKKHLFVERFLSAAIRESGFAARKFLENPQPYKSFVLSLESLESLSGEVLEISYTENFPWLREVDQKVINLVTTDESYRHMLSNILAVESYGETGGIFSRQNAKKIVKKIWFGSSSGDYQLRISSLFADLENDKTLEISLERMLKTLESPKIQALLHSFDQKSLEQIEEDLGHIEVIKDMIASSKNVRLPRKAIANELSPVLRFDTGDGSNVVWKIVSASLLIDKLALHSEKLDYMLISAGYDLSSIFDNAEVMQEYERSIIRVNNLREDQMLLALAENLIIRISEWLTQIKMPTKTVFYKSFFSPWRHFGRINYDKSIFFTHLKEYREAMEPGKIDPKVQFFIKKLDALIWNMENRPGNTNENIYKFLRDKELRTFLQEEDIDALLLPKKSEWSSNSFTRSVFHYVNKISILFAKQKKLKSPSASEESDDE
jgi:hypothetical protein